MASYEYTISTDFPNGKVDPSRLGAEIRASAIVTALEGSQTSGDTCTIIFKADLSVDDKATLDGLVAAHSGEPLPQPGYESDGTPIVTLKHRQEDGVPTQAASPRTGSEIVIGTHNFADPTTWFGDSVRVESEALSDSGDGLVWESAHVNWIDMRTGRMHNQEHWRELVDHQYAVEVKVDGVAMTHCAPFDFTSSTGDYWVDYDEGKIHFFVSQAGKLVTASYSYENGSTFYVRPLAGKVLRIEDAEADFSKDSILTTCFGYVVMGWADVFAPDMVPDPLPSGTLVPLQTDYYLRVSQIVTEARGSLPPIDPIGATPEELLITDLKEFRRKSRGMKNSVQAIPFNYATARDLHSSYGMELHVKTNDGNPVQGEHMTITFYCTSKDEG